MLQTVFRGSKGAAGSTPAAPVSTPDNLRSEDTVEVILGLGEGQWEGLVDGEKSFHVGDTQLRNSNGDLNFEKFYLKFHPGLDDPEPVIATLGGVAQSTTVNVVLTTDVAVVRPTVSGAIDFIEVRILINRLLKSTTKGTFNNTVKFQIEYKALSALEWTPFYSNPISISAKTTSTTVKEYRKPVARIEEPYEVRVTKITAENTTELFSDISWESMQEVISGYHYYNNTAVIHLVGRSSNQFSSIPEFWGLYRGIICSVPTNYDPITRVYTGMWDGTFKKAWTNNPAWVLYDFVLNDRYGVNAYYPVYADKFDFYESGQWCDELVSDGRGGTQPRYTFNAMISEPRSGKEMARYIAGSFNSTFFDDLNGKAILKVDKEEQAVQIFTPENVGVEGFDYSYTDIGSRYNDLTVTFTNPDLQWSTDRRRVFSQEQIDQYGRIPFDFIAVGCTNVHEAVRKGFYKLITATTEVEMVTFTTNRLAEDILPWDVILIADPDMGYGLSGRLTAVSEDRKTITFRDAIYLESGVSYKVIVQLGGSQFISNVIPATSGTRKTLTMLDALPENVPENAVFSVENQSNIGLPKPYRVMKVDEEGGSPDNFTIHAIEINRLKWDAADNAELAGEIEYSALPNPVNPPGPTSVGFLERFIYDDKTFQLLITPVFDRNAYKYFSNEFEVWSRPYGSEDNFVKRLVEFNDTIVNHPSGEHEFKILGKSILGQTSSISTVSSFFFEVTNPLDPPADPTQAFINDDEIIWTYGTAPEDFDGFEIRYHNVLNKTTWGNAIKAHEGRLKATSFKTALLPHSAKTIMIRAVDIFGVYSTNSAVILRDLGDQIVTNVVDQIDLGALGWLGTKTNCSVVGGDLVAGDDGTQMYSGVGGTPMYDGGDVYAVTYKAIEYVDSFSVTSRGRFTVHVDIQSNGHFLHYKPAAESTWYPMILDRVLEVGDYDLKLVSFGGDPQTVVNSMIVYIDADDVGEAIEDVAIAAVGTRLPITRAYSGIKVVNATLQDDAGSAIYFKVIDKDAALGPLVKVFDVSGVATTGTIDVTIQGF